jgi:hypothetical protein
MVWLPSSDWSRVHPAIGHRKVQRPDNASGNADDGASVTEADYWQTVAHGIGSALRKSGGTSAGPAVLQQRDRSYRKPIE